jgi:hypothetical protein
MKVKIEGWLKMTSHNLAGNLKNRLMASFGFQSDLSLHSVATLSVRRMPFRRQSIRAKSVTKRQSIRAKSVTKPVLVHFQVGQFVLKKFFHEGLRTSFCCPLKYLVLEFTRS